jgi:hypothetical protein
VSDARESFWRAPRRLARLLEERRLTPSAFTLLVYVGTACDDRQEGLFTTQNALRELLGVKTTRTIARALDQLASLGLATDTRRQGVENFHVRLTGALVSEAVSEPVSAAVSEVTSDTPPPPGTSKPRSHAGSTLDSLRTPRARARETETETETDRTNGNGKLEIPDGLAAALRRLGDPLHPPQLADVITAWRANPGVVERLVESSRGDRVDSPAAVFMTRLRAARDQGEFVPAGERRCRGLDDWLRKTGRRIDDEHFLRCLLEENFDLDGDALEAEVARWHELRGAPS